MQASSQIGHPPSGLQLLITLQECEHHYSQPGAADLGSLASVA